MENINVEQLKEETNKPKLTIENFPKEIEVKFITTTYNEKVIETPFKIPSELSRYGLSEIINHLLDHSNFLLIIKIRKTYTF